MIEKIFRHDFSQREGSVSQVIVALHIEITSNPS